MYSCLVAKVQEEAAYDFFTYGGAPVDVPFRGITRTLTAGQRFGVRKASSDKQIRMIFAGDPSRVMSLDIKLARKIAAGIKGG